MFFLALFLNIHHVGRVAVFCVVVVDLSFLLLSENSGLASTDGGEISGRWPCRLRL